LLVAAIIDKSLDPAEKIKANAFREPLSSFARPWLANENFSRNDGGYGDLAKYADLLIFSKISDPGVKTSLALMSDDFARISP
jgi:hypothetical protein